MCKYVFANEKSNLYYCYRLHLLVCVFDKAVGKAEAVPQLVPVFLALLARTSNAGARLAQQMRNTCSTKSSLVESSISSAAASLFHMMGELLRSFAHSLDASFSPAHKSSLSESEAARDRPAMTRLGREKERERES